MTTLRNEIDSIDEQIVKLLASRRDLSTKVIEQKDADQKDIRDPQREEELLRDRVKLAKQLGIDPSLVIRVFHEVIDDSLRLQHNYIQEKLTGKAVMPSKVAYHGIPGSYCTLAAEQYFGSASENNTYIGFPTFAEVIQAVESGRADCAVIPVENTTTGGINDIYDLLLNSKVYIVGEEIFKISHCLVGLKDTNIKSIKKILASHLSYSDSSNFINTLSGASVELVSDSAMAAKRVADQKDPTQVAVAGDAAAKQYGLEVVKRDITNSKDNYIRYLVVSKNPTKVDKRIPCKTSIVMSVQNRAGALVESLQALSRRGIDFKKLESRPINGNPFEEMFYLDFEGNVADQEIDSAIQDLTKSTKFIRVLGSYPSKWLVRTVVTPRPVSQDATSQDTKRENITVNTAESTEQTKAPTTEAAKVEKPRKKLSYELASRQHKESDTIIDVKGIKIGGNGFVVMAGPCSVESYDQIMTCAKHAKDNGAVILRGGCFKPRTSPYSFQGMGYEGLDILCEAGRTYGLPVITEVMSTEDVDGVAAKTDIIQVGARNMQNFNLLKALGKTRVPIMLKRGMSSTIEDLLNATEYILANGNQQVILCERGIRTFETATRTTLDISAVPVLRRMTHLPIIVDPSHAAGERDLVPPLAMAAKAVGSHGIIVEFHPDPEKALSDGPQALRFPQFEKMMSDLLGADE